MHYFYFQIDILFSFICVLKPIRVIYYGLECIFVCKINTESNLSMHNAGLTVF